MKTKSKRIKCKKVAYPSVQKLREGAKRLSDYYGGMVAVHGYFCFKCNHFHLTTKDYTESEKRMTDNLVF